MIMIIINKMIQIPLEARQPVRPVQLSGAAAGRSGISRIWFIHSLNQISFCIVSSCSAILRIEGCLNSTPYSILGIPYR